MTTQAPPNIIVLVFDTLRADVLSCYGGSVNVESFNRVSQNGTTFDNAYAAGPGTAISHAALFSGQYPSTNGVTHQTQIPETTPMLAEHLSKHGYSTFGIAGPSKMGSEWGYDRGFEEYYEKYVDHPQYNSPPDVIKKLAVHKDKWLVLKDLSRAFTSGSDSFTTYKFELLKKRISRSLESPYFAFMNTTLVHHPWIPPRPYMVEATPSINRPKLNVIEYLTDSYPTIERDDVRRDRLFPANSGEWRDRIRNDVSYLNDAELAILKDWYKACIRCLDDRLCDFLSWFDESECTENTILVLTSDHGEAFGEHGLWTHGDGLFDEVLNVPLLITGPGVPEGKRIKSFVGHIDIFDTLCELADINSPEETDGRALINGEVRGAAYSEYAPKPKYDPENSNQLEHLEDLNEEKLHELSLGRKCVRTTDYLYIYRSDGSERLYERPEEKFVPDPDTDICAQFREDLEDTLGLSFNRQDQNLYDDISEGVRQDLKELGYL